MLCLLLVRCDLSCRRGIRCAEYILSIDVNAVGSRKFVPDSSRDERSRAQQQEIDRIQKIWSFRESFLSFRRLIGISKRGMRANINPDQLSLSSSCINSPLKLSLSQPYFYLLCFSSFQDGHFVTRYSFLFPRL